MRTCPICDKRLGPNEEHNISHCAEALGLQLAEARRRVEELEAAQRWIPVDEQLPEELGRYEFLLISTLAGKQHAIIEAYDPSWETISPLITHWRKIVGLEGGEG